MYKRQSIDRSGKTQHRRAHAFGVGNGPFGVFINGLAEAFKAEDVYKRQAQGEAAEEILSFYERLDVNPRVLFLDAVTSKFILPALFAVMPFDMQDDNISTKALHYASLRKKLLKRLNIRLIPAAFSLRIDDTRLEAAADRPQMSILRRLLNQDTKGGSLSNCVICLLYTSRCV